MTALDFIRELCKLARKHDAPVVAIDFEPMPDGTLKLAFHLRRP